MILFQEFKKMPILRDFHLTFFCWTTEYLKWGKKMELKEE